MLRRLKNLWDWSAISPYEAGQSVGQSVADTIRDLAQKSEIVFPVEDSPKTEVLSEEDLDKALEELTKLENNG
jgi:hypothetical protein